MNKKTREALKLLGLPETALRSEVVSAWRTIRATAHPDRGGSVAEFDRLHKAYAQAFNDTPEFMPCQECGGEGLVSKGKGPGSIKLRCRACKGTGESNGDK